MAKQHKITLLAGGVGGAKMAEGFAGLANVELSVIGNIADDASFHGLWVSPDIDTLTYSLSGRIDRQQGWGVRDESHRALSVLAELGAPTWMTLGDRDLGLHIYRSHRLAQGHSRSVIAADIARAFGLSCKIILPTDDIVQTMVQTDTGWLSFQEYFVKERCVPDVRGLKFSGIEQARPTAAALTAISEADLIVIAPSNPLVSIDPIIHIPGIRAALNAAEAPKVAVSPLIDGKVVKGPADRMMKALGMRADVVGIAAHYQGLAGSLVIDPVDASHAAAIAALGLHPVISSIIMPEQTQKQALAMAILAEVFGG